MDRLIKFEPKTTSAAITNEIMGVVIEAKVREKIWQDVSKIVHELIDNPIKGVATRKKLKAAGVTSLIYKLAGTPSMDITPKENAVGLRLDFSFEYFGIRQGDTFINMNGARIDVYALRHPCIEIMLDKCRLTTYPIITSPDFPAAEEAKPDDGPVHHVSGQDAE